MNDDGDEKIDGRREYVKWQFTVLPTVLRILLQHRFYVKLDMAQKMPF